MWTDYFDFVDEWKCNFEARHLLLRPPLPTAVGIHAEGLQDLQTAGAPSNDSLAHYLRFDPTGSLRPLVG